ncbi:MAG: hypothetical protein C0462_10740 [Alcanivorax sp.]|nr:hypothetical protein [Alcanivorax sp.]
MELRMMRNDIHDVYIEKGTVWLKLTPSAASEFEQLTHQRLGKSLDVYVDGIHATTFDVQAVITSGTLEIRSPPEALLEKLQNR